MILSLYHLIFSQCSNFLNCLINIFSEFCHQDQNEVHMSHVVDIFLKFLLNDLSPFFPLKFIGWKNWVNLSRRVSHTPDLAVTPRAV